MKTLRLILLATLAPLLVACFQTSLGGPTGGTTLTIAPLREPTSILLTATTLTEADWIAQQGQAFWDKRKPVPRLLLLGITSPQVDNLDPDGLYLITATGGADYDPETAASVREQPEPVQGSWHAIASGQRIIEGKIQVSVLTEALYQQALSRLDTLDDSQLLEQLEAAARLIMTDVTDDGAVNYDDVLGWNRTLFGANYRGDPAALGALSTAIASGQPTAMLEQHSVEILGRSRVTFNTNFGAIEFETLNWEAPVTAENFLRYVDDGFYDNLIFHRTIDNFVIQAGIWELQENGSSVNQKATRDPVRNESRYSISNQRGTVAMARTSDPDSASSQFFVNQVANDFLDHGSASNPDGYTVFARVTAGLDVVDAIAALPTRFVNGIGNDVPAEIVLIESAARSE